MRKRDQTKNLLKKVIGQEQRELLKMAERYRDAEYPHETVAFVLSKIRENAEK
jgi:hypothetical protein